MTTPKYRYDSPNLPRGWRYVMITESAHTRPRSVASKDLKWSIDHTVEMNDEGESIMTAGRTRWKMVGEHPRSGLVSMYADEARNGLWAQVFHSHKMTTAEEAEWIRRRVYNDRHV